MPWKARGQTGAKARSWGIDAGTHVQDNSVRAGSDCVQGLSVQHAIPKYGQEMGHDFKYRMFWLYN